MVSCPKLYLHALKYFTKKVLVYFAAKSLYLEEHTNMCLQKKNIISQVYQKLYGDFKFLFTFCSETQVHLLIHMYTIYFHKKNSLFI